MFGGLTLATVVADYRKYVMPIRPFTLAMRVQHVGRYGRDADDPRLLPFVWLVQDVVRGYDGRQLPVRGCSTASLQGCDPIDAATTRRLTAANVELRFPIIGALRRTTSYGAVPLEGLVFSDAGAFWTGGPATTSTKTLVRSNGVGVRLNVGGFVFEFDAAKPVEPVARGWRLSVNFRPGF
jgi:outer membrane protein assembly factor BamA